MKSVLVIGASRGIGLAVVKRGLERGHAVRAFSRSAARIGIEDPRLERVDGDARSTEDLRRALTGTDAVVLSLGVPPGLGLWARVCRQRPPGKAHPRKRPRMDHRETRGADELPRHWAIPGAVGADHLAQRRSLPCRCRRLHRGAARRAGLPAPRAGRDRLAHVARRRRCVKATRVVRTRSGLPQTSNDEPSRSHAQATVDRRYRRSRRRPRPEFVTRHPP